MRNSLYILLGLPLTQVNAQDYIMSAINNGATFNTCSGTFYDSGGATGAYSSNEVRTITFCSDTPGEFLKIDFTTFNIENNYDFLEVFYGPTATGTPDIIYTDNLASFSLVEDTSMGCITFRFTSDAWVQRPGWIGNISCITPCVPPVAALVDNATEYVCSDDTAGLTITVDGSNSTSSDSFDINTYEWNWGDGSITTTTSSTASHTYAVEPGIYNIYLTVYTDNYSANSDGCASTNVVTKQINIVPPPIFDGSTLSQTIACGSSLDLEGIASSQTIVSSLPQGSGSDTSLPDNTNTPFESQMNFTGYFPAGATVSENCLPEITLNLEHSYAGDLEIILIAPSGEEVMVFDGYGTGSIGNDLFGYCVNGTDDTGPGCPAPYHIVNDGGLNWTDPGAMTNFSEPCDTYAGPCQNNDYFLQDGVFNSTESLTNLTGADLNGIWTIRVIDNIGYDDGYLESWTMSFPTDCYQNLEIVTPILTDIVWSNSGSGPAVPTTQTYTDVPYETVGIDTCPTEETCEGNQLTNIVGVGPFLQTGNYVYTLTAMDEYGCDYSYDVTITVEEMIVTFDGLLDTYCMNDDDVQDLPTTSSNGVEGTWSPASIDTSVSGETTYTFTPTNASCADEFELVVNVGELPIISEISYD